MPSRLLGNFLFKFLALQVEQLLSLLSGLYLIEELRPGRNPASQSTRPAVTEKCHKFLPLGKQRQRGDASCP